MGSIFSTVLIPSSTSSAVSSPSAVWYRVLVCRSQR